MFRKLCIFYLFFSFSDGIASNVSYSFKIDKPSSIFLRVLIYKTT